MSWWNKMVREEYLAHKRSLTLEQVIDEELVVAHLGTYESFETPYDAVSMLLSFYQGLGEYFEREKHES